MMNELLTVFLTIARCRWCMAQYSDDCYMVGATIFYNGGIGDTERANHYDIVVSVP